MHSLRMCNGVGGTLRDVVGPALDGPARTRGGSQRTAAPDAEGAKSRMAGSGQVPFTRSAIKGTQSATPISCIPANCCLILRAHCLSLAVLRSRRLLALSDPSPLHCSGLASSSSTFSGADISTGGGSLLAQPVSGRLLPPLSSATPAAPALPAASPPRASLAPPASPHPALLPPAPATMGPPPARLRLATGAADSAAGAGSAAAPPQAPPRPEPLSLPHSSAVPSAGTTATAVATADAGTAAAIAQAPGMILATALRPRPRRPVPRSSSAMAVPPSQQQQPLEGVRADALAIPVSRHGSMSSAMWAPYGGGGNPGELAHRAGEDDDVPAEGAPQADATPAGGGSDMILATPGVASNATGSGGGDGAGSRECGAVLGLPAPLALPDPAILAGPPVGAPATGNVLPAALTDLALDAARASAAIAAMEMLARTHTAVQPAAAGASGGAGTSASGLSPHADGLSPLSPVSVVSPTSSAGAGPLSSALSGGSGGGPSLSPTGTPLSPTNPFAFVNSSSLDTSGAILSGGNVGSGGSAAGPSAGAGACTGADIGTACAGAGDVGGIGAGLGAGADAGANTSVSVSAGASAGTGTSTGAGAGEQGPALEGSSFSVVGPARSRLLSAGDTNNLGEVSPGCVHLWRSLAPHGTTHGTPSIVHLFLCGGGQGTPAWATSETHLHTHRTTPRHAPRTLLVIRPPLRRALLSWGRALRPDAETVI